MAENKLFVAGFERFRRYKQGEMSLREQHLFEKQMLQDRMLADAYEGFLAMHDNNADLASIKNDLDKKLSDRLSGSRKRTFPIWAYGAAASLLITLGTLWLIFLSNPKKGNMEETGQNPVEEPLIQPKPKPELKTEQEQSAITLRPAPHLRPTTKRSNEPDVAPNVPETREDKGSAIADEASALAPAQAEKQSLSYSAKRVLPTGAASRVLEESSSRKSENVVTQTTAARQQAPFSAFSDSISRINPNPLMGWESYNAYLDQQVSKTRRNGEVTVNFTINADGTLTDFMADGEKKLQEEAIRIVREGPIWVPAKQNGSAATAPAKIKLRFKK